MRLGYISIYLRAGNHFILSTDSCKIKFLRILMQYTRNINLQNRNGLCSTFKKLFFYQLLLLCMLWKPHGLLNQMIYCLTISLIRVCSKFVTYNNDTICTVRYSQASLICLNYFTVEN